MGDQTFTQDKMNVRYMRGASVADDPTAPSGKVARVGRDWSIQWFLEPRKPVTMDYTRTYDVLALCKGDFRMGIYGVQRSGYVAPYRMISTPAWKQIRLVRDRIHPRDYLTTDGIGKPGSVAAVTFVEHPLSPEELAVQKENLPAVHIDAEQSAQICFRGVFEQPVELLTGMGKDKFCPEPELIVESVSKSGKIRSGRVAPGIGNLVIQPGTEADPVVQLVFRTTGKTGRTIADIAFRTPENPKFRIFSHSVKLGEINCYDIIRTNEQMRLLYNRSNFNAAREKLFAGYTGNFAVIPESTMRKVFEYDIRPEWSGRTTGGELNLSLAGREAEHLQLVIVPRTDKPEKLKIRWIPQDGAFPDVKFENCTGYKTAANYSNYNARFYQARYLAGKLAASMSKTAHLGYVAAMPIPEVLQGINAYTLGAQSVNPDVKVSVVWTNTWYDPGKEVDATNTLIGQGCDILTHHTDSTAVPATAESRGVKVISYHSAMTKTAPKQLIGAVTHHWDEYYAHRIQALYDGKWKVEPVWGGAELHMVRLSAITPDAPKSVVEDINAVYSKMEKKEFNVFSGPIVDNEGKVQIPEGKVADDKMLNTMNYFVKGVIGKVPTGK